MTSDVATEVLDNRDLRLIAALQCDGRLAAERAGEVLGISTRLVRRRWATLLGAGTIRVTTVRERPADLVGVLLRIKVLRGKVDAVAAALAARDDVPFIDLTAAGDEISAVMLTRAGVRGGLLYNQLPATSAVTSVEAKTVLHVFSEATDWRLDVLTPDERAALTTNPSSKSAVDTTDESIMDALDDDARAPAAAVAAQTGLPESTVRRRIATLTQNGALRTQVLFDPRRAGLMVDANLWIQVKPSRLDEVGRTLAAHPAAHGTVATTGQANLQVAVWVRDLGELYRLVTQDLGALRVTSVDTVLVGRAVKRPESARGPKKITLPNRPRPLPSPQ
ncbi:Lrp/AsnC family transcriptional regulator [Kutzneria sp. CA-103260]|uniref:Lrp/AsnC family transcriptional regulator n=1 Tax=Kutzneria sp. CA-103260 TaxID=2802641 RepID=UPI001BEFB622|nr:Lrp/AsnC family transcriptional regulator [Kutzneria sp. CA-103260]QUQ63394.1 AsnC family transcriptional regulator [Kutzneria sp. CA-103260]